MDEFFYERFQGERSSEYVPFDTVVDSNGDPVDMAHTYITILNSNGIDAKVSP